MVMVYEKATGPCTKGPKPGALALYQTIDFFEPSLAGNGVYNCRKVRGSTTVWSCHAEGRAMDFNAALPNGKPDARPIPAGSAAENAIHKWVGLLLSHHTDLGVQRVIYKNVVWTVNRGFTKGSTSTTKLHQNHVHIEMTRDKAANLTPTEIRRILFGK